MYSVIPAESGIVLLSGKMLGLCSSEGIRYGSLYFVTKGALTNEHSHKVEKVDFTRVAHGCYKLYNGCTHSLL